ncbi:DUF6879 family protein [Streptomyces sp. NPDC054834]
MVDAPPTDRQRFLLASAPGNVAAGEDIRNLTRPGAAAAVARLDLWLFDSKVVARFAFDEDDTTLGVYVTEDPAEVLAGCPSPRCPLSSLRSAGLPCPAANPPKETTP